MLSILANSFNFPGEFSEYTTKQGEVQKPV